MFMVKKVSDCAKFLFFAIVCELDINEFQYLL